MSYRSFIYNLDATILCGVLFLTMILALYAGRKFALKKLNLESDKIGAVSGSLLGLFAFILGFTYSMSNQRYDTRRDMIIQEANEIGTAVLRADVFPDSVRIPLRADFRKYVEARILYYESKTDYDKMEKAMSDAKMHGASIWNRVAEFNKKSPNAATAMAMASVNSMLDAETERFYKSIARVPDTIIALLFLLGIVTSFFFGCQFKTYKGADWVLPVIMQLMLVVVIYITLDMDRPRRGTINLDDTHRIMTDLRSSFQ